MTAGIEEQERSRKGRKDCEERRAEERKIKKRKIPLRPFLLFLCALCENALALGCEAIAGYEDGAAKRAPQAGRRPQGIVDPHAPVTAGIEEQERSRKGRKDCEERRAEERKIKKRRIPLRPFLLFLCALCENALALGCVAIAGYEDGAAKRAR